MRIFAHRQADNQTKSNSKAEAPFSTVVCGYSGRGPILDRGAERSQVKHYNEAKVLKSLNIIPRA